MYLILVCVFLVLKLLSFLDVHSDQVWFLKLFIGELGHLAGFFLFASTLLFAVFFKNKKFYGITVKLGFLTALLLLFPLLEGYWLQNDIKKQLEKNFPLSASSIARKDFGLSFKQLLTLETTELNYFKKLSYEPKEEVYWQDNEKKLKLLNYHITNNEKAKAWVLVVHGGGWDAGDAAQLSLLNYKMEQWGVAVFSLEYRLAPQSKWPAPLEDTYNAITWIKQHASELNVNFEKGFLLGRSAGGQIALSACYSQKVKEIKGCIAFYAPTDMEIAYKKSSPDDFFRPIPRITAVMGASPEEKPQVYKEASALQNVNASSVPTLLLHGTPDFWVWFGHSLNLYNKLQGLGVPSALIEFPWATHGFDVNLAGPSGQLSTDAVEWFLLSELEKK